MKSYNFTVILRDADMALVDALYEQCDDVSVGETAGSAYAAFDREAISLEAAIESATRDLRTAGLEPLRVEVQVPAAAG